MAIAEKIQQITQKRSQKVSSFKQKESWLKELNDNVKKIDTLRFEMLQKSDIDAEIKNTIQNISTLQYLNQSNIVENKLKNIIERFSRKEIAISVVGGARQGKSQLLQSISNLDNRVIPAFKSSDCTGATSRIKNVVGQKQPKAHITFYEQSEMIQIVQKYFDEIFGKDKFRVDSFEKIGSFNISDLKNQIAIGSAESAKFDHLKKYIEHFDDWKSEVFKGFIDVEDENKIQEYVSQHNGETENDPKRVNFYKYLAVKECEISCEFKNSDTGDIVLRDTIGLGDTSIGIEDKMLDSIGKYSDAAIIVRRPDSLVGKLEEKDVELYKKLNSEFEKRNMNKWLFWLVNKTTKDSPFGDNSDRCEAFDSKIRDYNWNIADHKIVNVTDSNDVNDNFLKSVLETLIKNIDSIDNGILSDLNEEFAKLYEEFVKVRESVNGILKDVFAIYGKNTSNIDLQNTIGDTYSKEILGGIREHCKKDLAPKCNLSCEEFENAVKEKLTNIYDFIPTDEEIKSLAKQGNQTPFTVYARCTDILRNKIINDFQTLDIVLDKIVNDEKKNVVDILANKSKGKLANLVSNSENLTPNEWIEELERTVSEEEYPHIFDALEKFRSFAIKVEGFMIFKVRNSLTEIDPRVIPSLTSDTATEDDRTELAQEILIWLRQKIEIIYEKIRENVRNLYSVPNEALFACVKDLFDRVTFARDDSSEYFSLMKEWENLYKNNLNLLFADEYEEFTKNQATSKEWKVIADSLCKFGDKKYFEI